MAYIPEPTLFASPPPGASDIQKFALYSHYAGSVISALVAVAAFARAPKKGVPSHVALGLGVALAGGAVFAAQSLYANFIYGECARAVTETGLFVMAAAAGLVAFGASMLPGFTHKRGAWLNFTIPGLAFAGFAIAGVAQLAFVPAGAGVALGAFGGVLVAAAGGLHLFDKSAPGTNLQEKAGTSVGFALIVAGVVGAIGAALTRTAGDGVDKGTMAIAIAEAAFSLFTLFGVLGVADVPAHLLKKKTEKAKPAPGAGYVPPPPGYVPPPPPGPAPRAPQSPSTSTTPAPAVPQRPTPSAPPRRPGA